METQPFYSQAGAGAQRPQAGRPRPGLGQRTLFGPRDQGPEVALGLKKMRPGFEGGQNPIYMRLGKQRGPYSADAMPMGPHRTSTIPVNVAALEERFDAGAEVTVEALVEKGLIRNSRSDVKLLGNGELTKKLAITVHAASATAREKVEAAGGSLTLLREPKLRRPKRRPKSAAPPEPDETDDDVEADTEAEAEAQAEDGPDAEQTDGEES